MVTSSKRKQQGLFPPKFFGKLGPWLKVIKNGWPNDRCQLPPVVQPYVPIRDTFSHQDDIVLKGTRTWMKRQLHSAHLGLASKVRPARDTIFWLGMRHDIQQLADNCHICQATKPGNQREPLYQHEAGSTPWEKAGVGVCEFSGISYLIAVDYFSNFIEVDLLTNTSAKQVIHYLKRHFARYGIPRCLHFDNAQQLVCTNFTEFMQSWRIIHSYSSPGHQSANGKAEADNSDQYLALLERRNTPRQVVNRSPAQIVFGHFTRSVLPVCLKPCTALDVRKGLTCRHQTKQCYDRYARPLSTLHASRQK